MSQPLHPTHPDRPPPANAQTRRRLAAVGLVGVGGLFGAAVREVMSQTLPTGPVGFPTVTLVINVSGSFAIGCVLVALFRAGDDTGRRRRWRLTVVTGFLGAYTTYSTFVVQADLLVRSGHSGRAVLYVVATVVGGLVAAAAGMVLAELGNARRRPPLPVDPEADQVVGEP